jgi:hypothetical protein
MEESMALTPEGEMDLDIADLLNLFIVNYLAV